MTNLRVLPFDGEFKKRLDVCKVSQQDKIGEIFPTAVCRNNQVEIAWQMGSLSLSVSQLADLADILILPSAAIIQLYILYYKVSWLFDNTWVGTIDVIESEDASHSRNTFLPMIGTKKTVDQTSKAQVTTARATAIFSLISPMKRIK